MWLFQVNFQNAHRPLPTFHLWDYSDTEQAFLQTIESPSRQRFAASVMKLDEGTWRHSSDIYKKHRTEAHH